MVDWKVDGWTRDLLPVISNLVCQSILLSSFKSVPCTCQSALRAVRLAVRIKCRQCAAVPLGWAAHPLPRGKARALGQSKTRYCRGNSQACVEEATKS